MNKKIEGISKEALQLLEDYPWPGNIRELENVIERAMNIIENGKISVEDLPRYLINYHLGQRGKLLKLNTGLAKDYEKINEALQRAKGNKSKAAKILGISRTTLYQRMRSLKID